MHTQDVCVGAVASNFRALAHAQRSTLVDRLPRDLVRGSHVCGCVCAWLTCCGTVCGGVCGAREAARGCVHAHERCAQGSLAHDLVRGCVAMCA